MFLLQKMHGKQIIESVDFSYHEPTGQQAGHREAEVAPFDCFKHKRDCGDCSWVDSDSLLLQTLLIVQSGPSGQLVASSSSSFSLLT